MIWLWLTTLSSQPDINIWWHLPALATFPQKSGVVTCSSEVSQTNQLPDSLTQWVCSPRSQDQKAVDGDALSQDPGDDGKRDHGTAGFKLQGRQEAFGRGIIIALSLQHLSQAVPDLMGCGVHLDSISEDLLCQAIAPKLVKYQSLQENKGKMAENGQ